MNRFFRVVIGTSWLAMSCGAPTASDSPCPALCSELYDACGIAAFPTRDSCIQGCEYDASEGADIDSQLTCIQEAGCDSYEIIECDHAYGIEE